MNQGFFLPRQDFCDTLALTGSSTTLGVTRGDIDPLEQMAQTDRADWALLRLVLCSALATMVLALASTLLG